MSGIVDGSKPMREKYFSEKDDTGKIDELKRELQRTQRQVKELSDLMEVMLQHIHIGNQLVRPVNCHGEERGNMYFRVHEFS